MVHFSTILVLLFQMVPLGVERWSEVRPSFLWLGNIQYMMMSFEEKVTFNFEVTYNLTKTESLHNVYVVPFLLHHQTKRNMYIQTSLWVNFEFGQYFIVTTTLKVYKKKTSSKQTLILSTFWKKQSLNVLFADRQPKLDCIGKKITFLKLINFMFHFKRSQHAGAYSFGFSLPSLGLCRPFSSNSSFDEFINVYCHLVAPVSVSKCQ